MNATPDTPPPAGQAGDPWEFLARMGERQDAQWRWFLTEQLKERRRERRGRVLFRLFLVLYLIMLLGVVAPSESWEETAAGADSANVTAVVDLVGAIMPEGDFAAEEVNRRLQDAFADPRARGVILRINSPGGTPVQAGMIHDEIVRLREKHPDKKIYAVVEDICASGGYYVAVATDGIYADKASIVGSIGVIMQNFGVVDAMQKLGVEERTLTAGQSKDFLSPFKPVDDAAAEHARGLLQRIHAQFIAAVRSGRGTRLKAAEDLLFSGLYWTGEQAVDLGLVDGLAGLGQVARDQVGAETLEYHQPEKSLLERLGSDMVGETLAAVRPLALPFMR
ncbi:MAG: S49 family peptidase [Magnetococcus sp. WYHC-3]